MNNYEKLLYKCNRQRNQLRKQHKKLTKLNFIIKEIEKYCNEEIKKRDYAKLDAFDCARLSAFYDIYEKLQELKGVDKE